MTCMMCVVQPPVCTAVEAVHDDAQHAQHHACTGPAVDLVFVCIKYEGISLLCTILYTLRAGLKRCVIFL
jgi:hypothetical protein